MILLPVRMRLRDLIFDRILKERYVLFGYVVVGTFFILYKV